MSDPAILPLRKELFPQTVIDGAITRRTDDPRRSCRVLDLQSLMELHQHHPTSQVCGGRWLPPAKIEPTLVSFDLLDEREDTLGVVMHNRLGKWSSEEGPATHTSKVVLLVNVMETALRSEIICERAGGKHDDHVRDLLER